MSMSKRNGVILNRGGKTDFPRGTPQMRLNADMGSVAGKPENFACKDAQKRHCLAKSSLASSGVSLRALSGASRDASEEVSVFRPLR